MSYINATREGAKLIGYIEGAIQHLYLAQYADADFSSCKFTKRSTSEGLLARVGPHSFFPLSGVFSKPTAPSHSSAESGVAAVDAGLRKDGIPLLCSLETLMKKRVELFWYGGDQSSIKIAETGENPSARRLNRTHGVDVSRRREMYANGTLRATLCVNVVAGG